MKCRKKWSVRIHHRDTLTRVRERERRKTQTIFVSLWLHHHQHHYRTTKIAGIRLIGLIQCLRYVFAFKWCACFELIVDDNGNNNDHKRKNEKKKEIKKQCTRKNKSVATKNRFFFLKSVINSFCMYLDR